MFCLLHDIKYDVECETNLEREGEDVSYSSGGGMVVVTRETVLPISLLSSPLPSAPFILFPLCASLAQSRVPIIS